VRACGETPLRLVRGATGDGDRRPVQVAPRVAVGIIAGSSVTLTESCFGLVDLAEMELDLS
jgi:hypothetical protein